MHPVLQWLVIVPAVCWAAVTDILSRRIANRLVAWLALLWAVAAISTVWHLSASAAFDRLGVGLASATAVLILGYVFFTRGWVGAGDVKLMAVVSLWFGVDGPVFLFITALAGGVLVFLMPWSERLELCLHVIGATLRTRFPWLASSTSRVDLSASLHSRLPYSLAIACGAFATLLLAS